MQLARTLYVTEHRAKVAVNKGNIMVSGPTGKARVPVETLSAIVLAGMAQVTTDALALCVKRGVRVCSLTRSGKVRFVVGGETKGNVLLRVAQIRIADDEAASSAIARWLVAGKIQNSRALIRRWTWEVPEPEKTFFTQSDALLRSRIHALPGRLEGDQIRGIEGDAARCYFACLGAYLQARHCALPFGVRSRRPPRDPVNALISFVYGLVHAEVNGAIESVGLDPQVGFLHRMRPGRQSLTLDLLEEFRSVADRFVVRSALRRQIRPEHFEHTPGGACYLNADGRKSLLSCYEVFRDESVYHSLLKREIPRWSLPTVQATLMARHIRGDLSVYAPYLLTA